MIEIQLTFAFFTEMILPKSDGPSACCPSWEYSRNNWWRNS